jgi:hypothetical protein
VTRLSQIGQKQKERETLHRCRRTSITTEASSRNVGCVTTFVKPHWPWTGGGLFLCSPKMRPPGLLNILTGAVTEGTVPMTTTEANRRR